MTKYIFLDNWVLSRYTTEPGKSKLSTFIQKNDYTILIDSLSLTELYNPGWGGAKDYERGEVVAEFLGQHACMIVDPQVVWTMELAAFPDHLKELPIMLDMNAIAEQHRAAALLMFLRRDRGFLDMGKDIAVWASRYEALKTSWSDDVDKIIKHALTTGYLEKDSRGEFINLNTHKEMFLRSLDGRHLVDIHETGNAQSLTITLSDIRDGASTSMRAIRASSLYFWYAYVDQDKSNPMRRQGSDIGDYFQMSILPYCEAFTVDKTMYRLANRYLAETQHSCELLDTPRLNAKLQLNV